jgi:hypothetical protein
MLDLRHYELRSIGQRPVALFCFLGILLPLFSLSNPFVPSEERFDTLEKDQKEWYIYVVDTGSASSIDVDSASLPHIVYYWADMGIRYAEWEDGSWVTSAIDNKSHAGYTHSMILDRLDRASVVYRNSPWDPNPSAIIMASRKGRNWTFDNVEDNPLTSPYPSISLDSHDLPGISYMKRQSTDDESALWFAKLGSNGTWSYEEIDSNGDMRYCSLYIDSNDSYHISYEELGDELRYAYWNGTKWSVEVVDAERGVGSWSSIKADKNGRPHIAYVDSAHREVKYANKLNGTWNITSIDSTTAGGGPSLDLDPLERPQISYQGRASNLKHAWWDGTAWNNEVVDNRRIVGWLSSMRIDDNGDIHISYRNESDPKDVHVSYATTKELPTGGIDATIDIDPDTLNLKSKGKFITAYIELKGADVRDIDASTIRLNDIVSPVLDERYGFVTSEDSYIFDHDEDGVPERMVKFWRSEVQAILDVGLFVTIAVAGQLSDGTPFMGTDEIRVIDTENLTKPKVSDSSHVTSVVVSPGTHEFRYGPILVRLLNDFDPHRKGESERQILSPPIGEPASSIVLKTEEWVRFWYRT